MTVPFDVVYAPDKTPKKKKNKQMIWVVGEGYVPSITAVSLTNR